MKHLLLERINLLFSLTTDIAHMVGESQYNVKISNSSFDSFGEQMCCIVGTRESYLKQAIEGGEYQFTCSVQDSTNKFQIMQALHGTGEQILQYAKENPTDEKEIKILLHIQEHEARCHGQLIESTRMRGWDFPESWKQHYTV